ncbi:Fe-S-containing hydro-lyase [Pseudoflavonifractor sp. MSJ-37]|uniref:Fe-S-containing hydro-lyase n=1 Tax=Pseudoflavonifractor sp. MSJ-37 TaxID=2841531 RepID=UPI001C0F627B|nr:Fe-S-containing hydro-lyase [Pseudoflavonifractor sp. MSJ-37]MBU5434736.1 Fe-S-containing hydro-lyase [Pseudoflavonifractor sp. MSJ-37]
MEHHLHTDDLRAHIPELKAGDRVILSGTIYTARDAAHKRFFELLDQGKELPLPLKDAVIYYAGPTPGQQGMAVGACGPTTASRMDAFAPRLLDMGLAAMIGKGERDQKVIDAIVRNGACYFAAVGGAGALIARCIEQVEVIAFDDLGCESVKRMTIKDLPLTVAIDSTGGNLFQIGRAAYAVED